MTINIPSLPAIGLADRLHCTVASYRSEGKMSDSGQVSCDLPEPSLIPQTPGDQGKVFTSPVTAPQTAFIRFYRNESQCKADIQGSATEGEFKNATYFMFHQS